MASPGTAQFFTTRPSGVLTPLIAVDELPAHVSIRGVTRTLVSLLNVLSLGPLMVSLLPSLFSKARMHLR
jgi:hypothetical protein